jgi:L-ribulose-5-phosphate 3-epimerase
MEHGETRRAVDRRAMMNRRNFVAASAALFAAGQAAKAARLPLKKGLVIGMLPKELSYVERFRLAKRVGFDEVESNTVYDEREAEEIKKAAEATGIRIHSVMNSDHWRYPLSSSDREVVAKSMHGMETSLRNAKLFGSDTVLLVPAVLNPQTSYRDAWDRSRAQIFKLLPMAQDLKVAIAVENVWNKFLLSPMEFASYVDSFQSPWVKAYFDVGNILLYGYPQDWIRTLGKRIAKIHLKDFEFKQDPTIKKRVPSFVALRDGEVEWKEVHQAIVDIGYKGSATVELSGGDEAYLKEVSRRVDLILEGA